MREDLLETRSRLYGPLVVDCETAFVGLFWDVDGQVVAVGVPVSSADQYGECLTFDGGHAEHWAAWAAAGAAFLRQHHLPPSIQWSEYDDHPRGRVVFDQPAKTFVIYADRRLHGAAKITAIKHRFGLVGVACQVRTDSHYR